MRHRTKLLALLALLAAITMNAQQSDPAKVLFEAARKKEVVDGDLKAAIELYKSIVSKFKNDRSIVADALLHMADCYEKLDDAESRKTYDRIVREYGDQKDAAAAAQARLGSNRKERGIAFRKVWSVDWPAFPIDVSPDGRYIAYLEGLIANDLDLVLHDTVSGTNRPVTSHKTEPEGSITFARISRDGKFAAYDWCNQRCELRMTSLDGTSVATPQKLFANDGVRYLWPLDWSPDGKHIAVLLEWKDGTNQIGLLSVEEKSFHVLKAGWRGSMNAFFSPDGRWLAFDKRAGEDSSQRDVFVLATDGSQIEVPAVVHPSMDVVMGWSPDQKHLLFGSDRNGSRDLWAIPWNGGKPQSPPQPIKTGVGGPLRLLRDGSMFFGIDAGDLDIQLATFDLSTGKQTAASVRPIPRFIGSNSHPSWSPDGKSLAYVSSRGFVADHGQSQPLIVIQSLETGEVRELRPRPELTWFRSLRWAPDGRSFLVIGRDLKGRNAVFQVDAQTEAASLIRDRVGRYLGLSWSPDATRIYFRAGGLVEHNLRTGAERQILPFPFGPISLSPDGQWIATSIRSSIVVVPVAGGEPRELLRLNPEEALNSVPMSWTPDGRAVIARKFVPTANAEKTDFCCAELWLVSTVGEPPLKLDIDTSRIPTGSMGTMDLHPDGRQLAYPAGETKSEVWVLENFLPTLKGSK